jgi:uncharacterized repeat protein (TIGR01451 family)
VIIKRIGQLAFAFAGAASLLLALLWIVGADVSRPSNTPAATTSTIYLPFILRGSPSPILFPPANSHTATVTSPVSIRYAYAIDPTTVTSRTFTVQGMQSGRIAGVYNVNDGLINLTPDAPFWPGELVQASATTHTLYFNGSRPLRSTVWQFWAAVGGGSALLGNSGQQLSQTGNLTVMLGDVDSDGDLDAVLGGRDAYPYQSRPHLWLNDGRGFFNDSGQEFGAYTGGRATLGDLDGDSDLDIFLLHYSLAEIWLNDGSGSFSDSNQSFTHEKSGVYASLGDVDGDGDLDALITGVDSNSIWLNNGDGVFSAGQLFVTQGISRDSNLGDLDGDGDLDAFVAVGGSYGSGADEVWLNNGHGLFSDSGQRLGNSYDQAVSLGDADGDRDLDAWIAGDAGSYLWLNNGEGYFSEGSHLTTAESEWLVPADLDGDGDLDALTSFYGYDPPPSQVWLNNGQGEFTNSGRQFPYSLVPAGLGDVDGDDDIDIWLTGDTNQVWLNENLTIDKHGPAFALIGTPITYTLTVANVDNISYTNVIISDTLPIGAFYVSGGTLTGNVAHWHLPKLAAGETVSVQLVVTATQMITNADYQVEADGGFWRAGPKAVVTTLTPLTVTATNPPDNGQLLTTTTPISVTFSRPVNASTVNSQTFLLYSQQTPLTVANVYTVNGSLAQLVSYVTIRPGDTLMATLSRDVQAADTVPLVPFNWQFRAAVTTPTDATFFNSGQPLGSLYSTDVAFADLNGDSALDVIVVNADQYGNKVFLNDGNGLLTLAQDLSFTNGRGVALGDLDNDGDLDALIANSTIDICNDFYCYDTSGFNQVFLNNGEGLFFHNGQQLGDESVYTDAVALGDLDGDGDLDAFLAAYTCDRIWLNDGAGQFEESDHPFCHYAPFDIALGDLDGDGDLDAFVADKDGAASWFNDGWGNFTEGSQSVDTQDIYAVELGDLDGDGDLDALLSGSEANYRLQNNGGGSLAVVQTLGTDGKDVALGDLDGDGDLDAFLARWGNTELWLNDGTGHLALSSESFDNILGESVDLGDIDGDGDLDAFLGVLGPNQLWLNGTAADLMIHKAQAAHNPVITYTLTFTNHGPHIANNVVITDLLPAALDNLAFSSSRPITATAGVTYSWQVGDLAINDGGRITVTGMMISDSIILHNQVFITSTTFDLHPADNQAAVTYNELAVVNTFPPHNSWELPPGRPISVTFNRAISEATVNHQNFIVRGRQIGIYSGTLTFSGNSVYFNPGAPFRPGEDIVVTLRPDIQAANGDPLIPFTWQFRAAVTAGVGAFMDTGQQLGNSAGLAVALGDLDGDGDLDAFVGTEGQGNEVWLNDGNGYFLDTGQRLGSAISADVALGDLDGDGDLDVYVATGRLYTTPPDEIWFNDGNGFFTDSGQYIGNAWTDGAALGDLDSDGDLDVYIGNDGYNEVWFNNGNGLFTNSGQEIGGLLGLWSQTWSISLGDLDGDGDLDAFEANHGPSLVMLNDGHGFFSSTGQNLGDLFGQDRGAVLGDVDGDGDLDVFLATYGANRVWFNDGQGYFTPGAQLLANEDSYTVALGDLDKDGDLDALVGNVAYPQGAYSELWLNDGTGYFEDFQSVPILSKTRGLAFGDLNGDGSLDAFLANWLNQPDRVWLNPSVPTSVTLTTLSPQPSAAAIPFVAILLAPILLLLAWHRYRTQ